MGLISWVVVGAIAGLLARRIVPGPDPGRFVVTIILGMAGASVGGFVVGVLGGSGATAFNVWSIFVATLGAVFLLYMYGLVARRTA
ncbi:MAG: GlsB/YeaQ/YmgE family stress response membrane protein [Actinomycetota bacterium]|nr:GlsB/YeaQ/YmgE family stress response membrane protein [Actinomycetota bacterium]